MITPGTLMFDAADTWMFLCLEKMVNGSYNVTIITLETPNDDFEIFDYHRTNITSRTGWLCGEMIE